MGIPVYFKTLIQKYQDSILLKDKLENINSLFLDLNCAIHPCCHGETDETIMIDKIISKIEELIEYTQVSDLLYIAIDGVPPKGKMKQQRMRRYKSVLENKLWDTNSISPGTYFMKTLNHKLKLFVKNKQTIKKIILSDTTERGEGEHKILQYIKKNNIQKSVIYGLDADLIMLSIVSQKENIYLLRERTEYNIEDTKNDYIYLMIDQLKQFICKDIGVSAPDKIVLNDYIFMCFLLGNDFINHLTSLNLRYKGYDYLMKTYQLLQERYQGYFKLIDIQFEHCIHLTFLKEFIYELSLKETKMIEQRNSIRDKQYKKIYNKYHELFNDFKNKYMKNNSSILYLENIYEFQNENNTEKCSEMINNLPLLFWPEEKKIKEKINHDLSKDYLDSLIWTSQYYFKECIHWKWNTKYDHTPSLKNFSIYLNTITNLSFEKENKEYNLKELLTYIFPNESHKLHDYNIQSKNYQLIIEPYSNRYLWECNIKFCL